MSGASASGRIAASSRTCSRSSHSWLASATAMRTRSCGRRAWRRSASGRPWCRTRSTPSTQAVRSVPPVGHRRAPATGAAPLRGRGARLPPGPPQGRQPLPPVRHEHQRDLARRLRHQLVPDLPAIAERSGSTAGRCRGSRGVDGAGSSVGVAAGVGTGPRDEQPLADHHVLADVVDGTQVARLEPELVGDGLDGVALLDRVLAGDGRRPAVGVGRRRRGAGRRQRSRRVGAVARAAVGCVGAGAAVGDGRRRRGASPRPWGQRGAGRDAVGTAGRHDGTGVGTGVGVGAIGAGDDDRRRADGRPGRRRGDRDAGQLAAAEDDREGHDAHEDDATADDEAGHASSGRATAATRLTRAPGAGRRRPARD